MHELMVMSIEDVRNITSVMMGFIYNRK